MVFFRYIPSFNSSQVVDVGLRRASLAPVTISLTHCPLSYNAPAFNSSA